MEQKDEEAQNREDLLARERIRYQWMLESVSKVRLFFAGLVFAMLSFSVQFAVATENRAAKGCQLAAWILLLLTGMLSVRDAGGFVTKHTQDKFDGLSPAIRRRMWWCFVIAVVLLMSARVLPEAEWGWAMIITKYLTLTGLVLDIAGVLVSARSTGCSSSGRTRPRSSTRGFTNGSTTVPGGPSPSASRCRPSPC